MKDRIPCHPPSCNLLRRRRPPCISWRPVPTPSLPPSFRFCWEPHSRSGATPATPRPTRPHFLPFALTLIGAILAQAAGNVLNDYVDFLRGVDTQADHGSGVLPQGLLTKPQMLNFGILLLALAGACGAAVILLNPAVLSVVIPLALSGAAFAVLYTPLFKRFALGDLIIMLAFGLGITIGAYAVQSPVTNPSQWAWLALYSLPLTLLVDGILHANNMRDVPQDKAAGVHTMAGLMGEKSADAFMALLLFGPVAAVVAMIFFGLLPWSCLAVVMVVPVLIKAYKTRDVPFIAQSHLIFGVLYSIGVAAMPPR